MSSDPAHVYVRSMQKRILRVFLVTVAILIVAITPLVLSSSLRMDLAYRFELAPGANVEQVADADANTTLIVVPIEATVGSGRPETRYHAVYLARERGDTIEFTNLDSGSVFDVPLGKLDLISSDPSGEHILLTEGTGRDATRVLVTVASNSVENLPPGATEPGLLGDWSKSIWDTRIGRSCLGISPQQTYIACFRSPTFARYLAGDWQIDVHRYGEYRLNKEIFRGRGTQPVVGFTGDDSWLYFQNEHGIWREPMRLEMFDE
jgi:hypothetical protein